MVTSREVIRVDTRERVPDVDTDGRVADQIQTLSVQAIFLRRCWTRRVTTADGYITSLHVFPEKRKKRVAQMPTSHG